MPKLPRSHTQGAKLSGMAHVALGIEHLYFDMFALLADHGQRGTLQRRASTREHRVRIAHRAASA